MPQNKLFLHIQLLSAPEFKRFYKFIQSPFFNTNPTLIKLYQILKKYYPTLDSPKLEKERVFKLLYPDKAFQYHHLANLYSDMTKLIKAFLIQMELEQESVEQQKILVKAYQRRSAYDLFEKNTELLIKRLKNIPFRDAHYYFEMMQLKRDYFFHPKTGRYDLNNDLPEEIMQLLDRYFVLSKIELAGVLKSREKMLSTTYEIRLLEPSIAYVNDQLLEEHPLFSIYLQILGLHTAESEQAFFTLKQLFIQHITTLKSELQGNILQHLLNFVIRKINLGEAVYNQDALALYKIGLDRDLILRKQKIRAGTFINITSVAGVLGEFEWAKHFISDYSKYLDGVSMPDITALSIAELEFRQRKFDATIDLISQKRFTIPLYETKARFLMIRSWYETFLTDPAFYSLLVAQMEAFEKFLKRDDLLSAVKVEGYHNFLKLLRQLVKENITPNKTLGLNQKLINQINQLHLLAGKSWLLEKIELL